MQRITWTGALLLGALCAVSAQDPQTQPSDLSGLWTVSGQLPNGEALEGAVALTPLKTANRYRALVADGSGSSWRASAWVPQSGGLHLRPYKNAKGVAGALNGAGCLSASSCSRGASFPPSSSWQPSASRRPSSCKQSFSSRQPASSTRSGT